MSKTATKAGANVFYQARMEASKWNDRLCSREGAAEVTGLDRTRIAYIELGTINPHPEEVLILADTYNAPELYNYFCAKQCPLGMRTVSCLDIAQLERSVLQVLSCLETLPSVKTDLINIAADGIIDESERPKMESILSIIDNATTKMQSLKLVVQKELGKGSD